MKAIVTGASTGIGRAVAVELGRRGWWVGLVARRESQLQKTKELVQLGGGEAEVLVYDLASDSQVDSLIQKIKSIGKVDMLVNAAGVWHGKDEVYAGKKLQEFGNEVVDRTMTVGLLAPMRLVAGLMENFNEKGLVLNVSGTFENGGRGWIPYFVSKRGMEDFTVGLAQELEGSDMRVVCVSPSDTATEEYMKYFPEDAVGANSPEFVAKAIADMYESSKNGEFLVVRRDGIETSGYHL